MMIGFLLRDLQEPHREENRMGHRPAVLRHPLLDFRIDTKRRLHIPSQQRPRDGSVSLKRIWRKHSGLTITMAILTGFVIRHIRLQKRH
ncbi:hypothetical protein DPMN_123819 [Dreissena polymorpha]|uniref:Uncharacterized protein n=1 Tax=Dreissena polymorpha TaxID=45954 RepID=A0A9D4JRM8_DREPO|nr:hypothetical protein DPMN_123819 [Dreissena polymorpha]